MTLKPYGGAGPDHVWIKSSYSTDEGPDCVEVATAPAHVLVRDSKNPDGPRLTLAPTTWATFLPYASGN
ncbi:DUF397 domain-containing protein [Streptomyces sp. JB150]|uniref:DUF397 domain-containing protein n=1 Tax=Streptomyces sp. JB150 TaxID=2714844 RepID=UPI00140BCD7F|nr:DUF397 domain-containing protein [Streptomyces sp. JB150]QIJ64034.1 DUF397 domain-containing protein [Streptomyces sp. JB150]